MRVISILSKFAIKNWSAKVSKNQPVLAAGLFFWACPAAFSVRPMALPQKAAGQAFRCKVFVYWASGCGGSGFRWSPAQPRRLSQSTANAFRYSPSRGKIVHKSRFHKAKKIRFMLRNGFYNFFNQKQFNYRCIFLLRYSS
ncbi:hypothetical protein [Flavobacterium aurantiibacter]|uniref:Uncharacterized protein n=1 Tax=Flavobacterium aurantiibacter TaxID=2023067 RepID=A0A255ZPP5_9FLAO|nr:hypothetical protein [Flavobacterium aurantiibacter]OYQ43379.1 hypothetical protein CHX27_10295 [Flavobacterium aurantiibacter]